MTGSADALIKLEPMTDRQTTNASGWLRDHPNSVIVAENLPALITASPPSVAERADRILRELVRNIPYLGEYCQMGAHNPDDVRWLGISWSLNWEEFFYLIDVVLLQTRRLVSSVMVTTQRAGYSITPAGYAHLEELKQRPTDSQIGFCAMWFDPAMDVLWSAAIEPAISEAGYQPKRIDKHEHVNKIDDEIVAMLRRSKFVVSDFTGQRGGVYFEAGFAMGLGLPVIWACNKDHLKDLHFDTRQYNFLLWEGGREADIKLPLRDRIVAILGPGTWKP